MEQRVLNRTKNCAAAMRALIILYNALSIDQKNDFIIQKLLGGGGGRDRLSQCRQTNQI